MTGEGMTDYELSWITDNLALGHAPMSYAELDAIAEHGITGIVNLCAEFGDLHEIQAKHGFEVYYLPTFDDEAPDLAALEKALDWLDEAVYLGKKVLVHCRHGIGRTGTFVTAYLLRKGFGLKLAKKNVEAVRATSASFQQWKLLKNYDRKAGRLTVREPSLEGKRAVDLGPFFADLAALQEGIDAAIARLDATGDGAALQLCGRDDDTGCRHPLQLELAEAAYLAHSVNRLLPSDERRRAIERAAAITRSSDKAAADSSYRCPLNVDGQCIVFAARPLSCRLFGLTERLPADLDLGQIEASLVQLSRNLLLALTATLPDDQTLSFALADVVSGRFVQRYFEWLLGRR